jgi:hypothetical protein
LWDGPRQNAHHSRWQGRRQGYRSTAGTRPCVTCPASGGPLARPHPGASDRSRGSGAGSGSGGAGATEGAPTGVRGLSRAMTSRKSSMMPPGSRPIATTRLRPPFLTRAHPLHAESALPHAPATPRCENRNVPHLAPQEDLHERPHRPSSPALLPRAKKVAPAHDGGRDSDVYVLVGPTLSLVRVVSSVKPLPPGPNVAKIVLAPTAVDVTKHVHLVTSEIRQSSNLEGSESRPGGFTR